MTHSRMVARLVKETGYPPSVVNHILDKQGDILRECFLAQDEVHFPGLMKVRSETREVKYTKNGVTEEERKVVLYVRPMKTFRKELNKWTSLASS